MYPQLTSSQAIAMANATPLGLLMRQRLLLTPSIRLLHKSPRASFATTSRPSRPIISNAQRQVGLRNAITRSYAVSAPAAATPPPPKKRGTFRAVLRWSWRLTYISAIAGLAYVGYGIYIMRFPEDQEDPDPSKKTLVILGENPATTRMFRGLITIRYWLGLSVPS